MRIATTLIGVTLLFVAFGVTGCGDKLVGHNGETSISLFPNKADFDKVMSLKSQGGAEGLLGGVGESMMTERVAENTPVKILSSDAEGYEIEVLKGPEAGTRGYVAKDNVN